MTKVFVPELLKLDLEMSLTENQSCEYINLYVEPEIWLAVALKHYELPITQYNIKSILVEWESYYKKIINNSNDKFISLYEVFFNDKEIWGFDKDKINELLLSVKNNLSVSLSLVCSEYNVLHLDELHMYKFGIDFVPFKLRQKSIAMWCVNRFDEDSNELLKLKIKSLHRDLLYYIDKYAAYDSSSIKKYKYRTENNLGNCLKLIGK